MPLPDSTRAETSTSQHWFTTTHWSMVLAAKGNDLVKASIALEKLCRAYWPPLYAYIRREGYATEDAQDLTQEFFAQLLEKNYLGHLQHQRGKFRSFLLTFLKHFLSDARDHARALKRGGGKSFISLDEFSEQADERTEPAEHLSPDQLFERRWAQTVLDQALCRLREEYVIRGDEALFDRLKDLQPGEHGSLSYADIGQQTDLTEAAIKSAVFRLRQRHREILREEIAQTVARPEEIDDEIRYLLTVLSR